MPPILYLRDVLLSVATHPQGQIAQLAPRGWAETFGPARPGPASPRPRAEPRRGQPRRQDGVRRTLTERSDVPFLSAAECRSVLDKVLATIDTKFMGPDVDTGTLRVQHERRSSPPR